MRKLFVFLVLLVPAILPAAAQSRITLTITVTNKPVTGNTITINGATRTWGTTETSTTILTNQVSAAGAKTNIFRQFSRWSFAGPLNLVQGNTNQFQLVAPFNGSLSASASGTWATLLLSTQAGGGFTYSALYPLENMVSSTDRVNEASSLAHGLDAYSTNAFSTNSTLMSNFFAKGSAISSTNFSVLGAPARSVLFESNGVVRGSSDFAFTNNTLFASNITVQADVNSSRLNVNTINATGPVNMNYGYVSHYITMLEPPLTAGYVITDVAGDGIMVWAPPTGGGSVISNASLLFVASDGNNGTAVRGHSELPWATPNGAKLAALAGDTIIVFPGNYHATNLWKNNVNWHLYNGCLLSNLTANPAGIFDNTELGTQGAITSNITGDGIILSASTDTTSTNETGAISIANSNSVIYVHCRSIWGGPDSPSFYALCLRDGYRTTIECDDIDSIHIPGGINSSVLWHAGEASLVCNTIVADTGYGIWGQGFKPGNFHVRCHSVIVTNYSFVFWQPTNPNNKLWLTVDEAAGEFGGVSLGALTQLGGKVYLTAQKVSMVQGANPLPVFYLSEAASASELWVNAQKVSITNASGWLNQLGGVSDFSVMHYVDDGSSIPARSSSWLVSGGTNYVHGGRFSTKGGPFLKSDGGLTVIQNAIINTSAVNQNTNYPIWMSGGAVTLTDVKLIAPASAFTIGADAPANVRLENTRHNLAFTNTVTGLVGPWTIDSNVQ